MILSDKYPRQIRLMMCRGRSANCSTTPRLIPQPEHRFGEGFAHQRERFRAAEVVVAGVRRAPLPYRGFGRRDYLGLILLLILALLLLGHLTIGIGVVFMPGVQIVAHLTHFLFFG